MSKHLPKHLQAIIENRSKEDRKYGIDRDWAAKVYKKAEKEGNHFSPIYALIG